MEKTNINYYELLKKKREYYEKYKTNQGLGMYYIYFVSEFLPRLIEKHIDDIKVDNLNSANRIDYQIGIFTGDSFSIMMDSGYHNYMHIPSKYSEDIVDCIRAYLARYEIGSLNGNKLTISANIKHLIASYEFEYQTDQYSNLNPVEKKDYMSLFTSAYSSMSSKYADYMHAKLFEKEFLDGFIGNAIARKIDELDISNYDKTSDDKLMIWDLFKFHRASDDIAEGLSVEDGVFSEFAEMVEEFIKFYNLGHMEDRYQCKIDKYERDCGYGRLIGIRLSTNLKDLIDAYYLEKERISYCVSGDHEQETIKIQKERISK